MLDVSFLKPEEVIEFWDVRPGEKIADFGCGPGFFSIPLGAKVGVNGTIYAIDVRTEALDALKPKIKLFHLFNIEPVRADLERPRGSGLKDESVNKVLATNILFQAENKRAIADEAFRILKPGGSVMVIEWNEDNANVGPQMRQRIDRERAEKLFNTSGFSFHKEFAAGPHHYGLILKK